MTENSNSKLVRAFPFMLAASPSASPSPRLSIEWSSFHENSSSSSSSGGSSGSTLSSSKQRGVKDQEDQEKYKLYCDGYVRSGLTRNVTIQFLMNRLVEMGCDPPKGFIKCIDCGDKRAGGGFGVVEEIILSPPAVSNRGVDGTNKNNNINTGSKEEDIDSRIEFEKQVQDRKMRRQCGNGGQGGATMRDLQQQILAQNQGKTKLRLLPEIFLCQPHLVNEQHAHESMVHELIHAIDLCRTKMDPINNCIHMACTEIRAENLSGECSAIRELVNQRTTMSKFRGHGAECVKRRAILSVKANPNCTEKAADYVDAAFERCFRDTFPFDRHPNLR